MFNNIIMISSALVDHRGSSTGTATAMIRRERGNASCSSDKALGCQHHRFPPKEKRSESGGGLTGETGEQCRE